LVQVPHELRKCVCFVGGQRGHLRGVGAAFFVGDPLGLHDAAAVYVVTAKHCVQPLDAKAEGPFDKTWLRVNLRHAGSMHLEIPPEKWTCHESADVAVLPLALNMHTFDYLYYPVRHGATAEFIKRHSVTPGEDVFITGLLISHPGKSRVLPIVRVGNIAAFPEDPITLLTGQDSAYLVEVRSLGGLSGSPAFVHLLPAHGEGAAHLGHATEPAGTTKRTYLMGLVHGFFPTMENDPDGIGEWAQEPLNTGISVVVPLERVLDIIDSPSFVDQRELAKTRLSAGHMPAPAFLREHVEYAHFEELASGHVMMIKREADEVERDP
jgi:hypothetical protein